MPTGAGSTSKARASTAAHPRGPWMVTADEIEDPKHLRLQLQSTACGSRTATSGHHLHGRCGDRVGLHRHDPAARYAHRCGHAGRGRVRAYAAEVPTARRRDGDRGRAGGHAAQPDRRHRARLKQRGRRKRCGGLRSRCPRKIRSRLRCPAGVSEWARTGSRRTRPRSGRCCCPCRARGTRCRSRPRGRCSRRRSRRRSRSAC